jgi:hypothetical protein
MIARAERLSYVTAAAGGRPEAVHDAPVALISDLFTVRSWINACTAQDRATLIGLIQPNSIFESAHKTH